jgi:hypothetical protein
MLGGATVYATTGTLTSQSNAAIYVRVSNRGQSLQRVTAPSFGAGSAGGTYISVDTSVDRAFVQTGNLSTATDYIVLEAFTVEVLSA